MSGLAAFGRTPGTLSWQIGGVMTELKSITDSRSPRAPISRMSTSTCPRNSLIVMTGLSGSGKSSLAFDTIYAEGQRRYVESLSAYARQFLEMMQKPRCRPDRRALAGDSRSSRRPPVATRARPWAPSPRSTITCGLLFARRVGVPYSPATGLPIESQTISQMVDRVLALEEGTRLYVLAPVVRGRKGEYRKELADFMKKGFQRVKIDGQAISITEIAGQRRPAPTRIPSRTSTCRRPHGWVRPDISDAACRQP